MEKVKGGRWLLEGPPPLKPWSETSCYAILRPDGTLLGTIVLPLSAARDLEEAVNLAHATSSAGKSLVYSVKDAVKELRAHIQRGDLVFADDDLKKLWKLLGYGELV